MNYLKFRVPATKNTDGYTSEAQIAWEAAHSFATGLTGILQAAPKANFALELTAHNGRAWLAVGAPAELITPLTIQLYAAFPAAQIESITHETTTFTPETSAGLNVFLPTPDAIIRSADFTAADPLAGLFEQMSNLRPADHVTVQLVLTAAQTTTSWSSRSLNALANATTTGLRQLLGVKIDAPDKSAKPLPLPGSIEAATQAKPTQAKLQAELRILAVSSSHNQARHLVEHTATALHTLAIPGASKFDHQAPRRLSAWWQQAMQRQPTDQHNFVITAAELANLYHPPLSPDSYPQFESVHSTRLPIPDNLSRQGLLVGYAVFRDRREPIRLATADRLRHTYLIGQTGTGKSSLFQTAMLQDIQNGDGACFIDPHGEAIEWLLPRIPAARAKDVILFDPSDPRAILGLNLLEWRTPHERDLLIQELIALFYRLFDPEHTGIIGPQFEHWLRNAALTITEPAVRGTIVDIPRLFTDRQFADTTVAKAEHWAVKDFWYNQMAHTSDFHKSEMLNYFTSKFGGFLGNATMHQILSAQTSAFDLRTIMDRRKILLVNLSKGQLGSLNAQLLGTLIVTKIQLAAMARADTAAHNRPPFFVYIDEFQNVVTDSFAQMLSEIRKYGVALHLAHQYVDQLPHSVKQAVIGNVGTLMAYRLGRTDADWLQPHFAPLTAADLTRIEPYHYHMRALGGGQLTPPFTVAAPYSQSVVRPAMADLIRDRVRHFAAQQP